MKISNETKVGVIAAVSIAAIILGFNFLKGKNVFKHTTELAAEFPKVDGLTVSSPVFMNGLKIGRVTNMAAKDQDLSGVIVTMEIEEDLKIPSNSVAKISPSILGTPSLSIEKGNAKTYFTEGQIMPSAYDGGMLEGLQSSVAPVLSKLDGTLQSLDSVVQVVGQTMDPASRKHLATTLANLDELSKHLSATAANLEKMMANGGTISNSLSNIETVSGSLAGQQENITATIKNLKQTSQQIADAGLDKTLANLQTTVTQLNELLTGLNSGKGSAGLLLNDPQLYKNLEHTTRSLNILLDDLRMHPKRYVNVSVFGKKDKSTPLSAPLSDSAK